MSQIFCSCVREEVYKESMQEHWGCCLGFGAEHPSNFQRGHQPSVAAITVPLMGQEYIPEEKCALFIHLHMPQVVWAPLVSVV